jgi:hypothetical protein
MSDFDTKKVEEARGFVSSLGTGREAFHSEVTEYCLRIGERSAEDFIRHFPPSKIMQVLASRPMERARIVTEATGIREKVALKMSPDNSGEALQIALDEKVTMPADIVRLFQPDDRQRYLDRRALWKFDVEGEPWKVSQSGKGAFERAKAYVAYILERALANLLVNHEEIIEALTVDKLATLLPRDQLGAIISIALKKGDKFTEAHLLEAVPPSSLVKHIPLDYIWERVINPLVAERHEYTDRGFGGLGAKSADVKGPAKPDEPSWTAPPSAVKTEEDGDLVGEDEIMEDAFGDDETKSSKRASASPKRL